MAPSVQLGPLRSPDGTLFVNDFDKANAFNKFFHSVFIVGDDNAPDFNLRTNGLSIVHPFRGKSRHY